MTHNIGECFEKTASFCCVSYFPWPSTRCFYRLCHWTRKNTERPILYYCILLMRKPRQSNNLSLNAGLGNSSRNPSTLLQGPTLTHSHVVLQTVSYLGCKCPFLDTEVGEPPPPLPLDSDPHHALSDGWWQFGFGSGE